MITESQIQTRKNRIIEQIKVLMDIISEDTFDKELSKRLSNAATELRDISKEILTIETPEDYQNKVRSIEDFTEEQMFKSVQKNPSLIEYFRNPPESVCMEAIRLNPYLLFHIENQTPEMCQLAVSLEPLTFEGVKNKTPELFLLALKKDRYYFLEKYISRNYYDPLPLKYLKMAIKYEYTNFRHIKKKYVGENVYCVLCEYAMQVDVRTITWIENPTFEMMLAAVKKMPQLTHRIKNEGFTKQECLQLYRECLKADPDTIKEIPLMYRLRLFLNQGK